jgi:hypothetical protein
LEDIDVIKGEEKSGFLEKKRSGYFLEEEEKYQGP